MRFRIGFLLSIALHLACVLLLRFAPVRAPEPKPTPPKTAQIVELTEPVRPKGDVAAKGRKRGGGRRKGIRSLSQLNFRYFASGNYALPEPVGRDPNGPPGDDDASSEWGSGGGEFWRIEDYRLMRVIFESTQGLLNYPSILASRKISGTVNARLVLDAIGVCDWHATQIRSHEAHLRVYVLTVLKKLCRQDFGHFVRGRKRTNVDFSFQFAITEPTEPLQDKIDREEKIVGNVLLFYRGSMQSSAEWHVGPLRGVFPVPYVSLDFAWLQENWEKYVEGKDAMEEFREK